ncbi:response regulator [Alteromonas pelagimontana]|uniref:Response regulator n=1 Tax=Alteromonas pelagimontana TaxID=1858656 RepID=A0A6M4MH93_9ALTE|nr:response regulator [Alteromonas pelagimontana]QJR82571.1 response regulator [Alteromonas pelagimontana]
MIYADKQVLIVEDQRPFLLLLRGLMNSMGATDVVTKSSAEQAISLCRRQKFDIVIADLHLGSDKKNGYEFIEELRVRQLIKPSTIFLLISADSARPVVLGSIERRPDDYLVKPFSQAQLKSRIARAWHKRQYMAPIYGALFKNDTSAAIAACKSLAVEGSPYQRSCEQMLVQLYWNTNELSAALAILTPYEDKKPALWAYLALSRTYLLQNQKERAIEVARKVLELNRFSAEAYDVIAEAQNNTPEAGEMALESIRHAIKLSPFSLSRHFTACSIARDNNDYALASESSHSIWHLSKRTVHQSIVYWCGYIRSILDVAEHAEDKRTRNRYQQEAILVLQRGKFDETLSRMDETFSVDIFEQVMNARICSLDGKMLDAKRNLVQSQSAIKKQYENYPPAYAPDSLKVMYDLGEYDDAQDLIALLKQRGEDLDPNSQYLIASELERSAERQREYATFNRKGIQLYQEGQFEQAKEQFILAQQLAPVNTGVALNLLQCMLKILHKNTKGEPALIKECKRMYKLVEDTPLQEEHAQKLADIKDELFSYIQ